MVYLVEFGEKSTWIDLIEEPVMLLIQNKGSALISIENIKNEVAEELSADDIVFIKEAFRLKNINTTDYFDGESGKECLQFTEMKKVK